MWIKKTNTEPLKNIFVHTQQQQFLVRQTEKTTATPISFHNSWHTRVNILYESRTARLDLSPLVSLFLPNPVTKYQKLCDNHPHISDFVLNKTLWSSQAFSSAHARQAPPPQGAQTQFRLGRTVSDLVQPPSWLALLQILSGRLDYGPPAVPSTLNCPPVLWEHSSLEHASTWLCFPWHELAPCSINSPITVSGVLPKADSAWAHQILIWLQTIQLQPTLQN